jgi:hypothetical protein
LGKLYPPERSQATLTQDVLGSIPHSVETNDTSGARRLVQLGSEVDLTQQVFGLSVEELKETISNVDIKNINKNKWIK